MKKQFFLVVVALVLSSSLLFAQKGKIAGTIVDNTNAETLIGATVVIAGTTTGAATDIDGKYEISVNPGTYSVSVSYVSFIPQEVKNVVVKAGETTTLDINLKSESQELTPVVITSKIEKRSVSAVLNLQQKSPSFVTGIVADEMRKSPDRTTSDVLKRVSGTSIQDNKFVVIRGLADRYNTALINGLSLPSTEPDRRAFSFDLFPSNLLDNLIIYKTATPDLPGEFAGGVILLNTKEIPEEGFTSFSVGTGYNSISTGKAFHSSQGSNLDWLGYGNKARALPSTLNTADLKENATAFTASKLFANDWNINNTPKLGTPQSYQFSLGRNFGKLGLVSALTYSNTPKIQSSERADFNVDGTSLFQYQDVIYKRNVALGGLLNFAYKLGDRSKIQFNNVYSNSADDQFIERTGDQYEQARKIKGYSMYYTGTSLISNQLLGEHVTEGGKFKAKWGASYSNVNRTIPSYRRMLYTQNYDDTDNLGFSAEVPIGTPSPNYAGRFYSSQKEQLLAGNGDFTFFYNGKKGRNSIKTGFNLEHKNRDFTASVFGYKIANISKFNNDLRYQSIDKIFAPENISTEGFKVQESTDRSDNYDANADLIAGYLMTEQNLSNKLRLVGGVRLENYRQQLNSFKVKSTQEIHVNSTNLSFMPSLNLTFAQSEKTNFRLSASRTVARPNFRELAPFTFYDFLLDASIQGNPNLVNTKITNLDARYEYFPGQNQLVSVSAFYKHFQDPIEQHYSAGGTRVFDYINSLGARNFGAELELRSRLGNFNRRLENVTFFSNVAYIYSEVDQSNLPGAIVRGLQGQSPYILNAGLSYQTEKGTGATVLFNRIGRRIWLVGDDQYKHTYEAPRSVIDFQITQKIFKNGDLKINVGDILNQQAVFYQDQDSNGKFNADKDTKIASSRFGWNSSLSFSYKF